MRQVGGQGEFPQWASGFKSFLGQPQQQQGQGWNMQQAMQNFVGMPQGGPIVQTPGQSPGTIGPVDLPPADLNDPFGGRKSELVRAGFVDPEQANKMNVLGNWFDPARWGGFGLQPSFGQPAFGPTQVPTNWTNYPGVGFVPMAIQNTDNPQIHFKPLNQT